MVQKYVRKPINARVPLSTALTPKDFVRLNEVKKYGYTTQEVLVRGIEIIEKENNK